MPVATTADNAQRRPDATVEISSRWNFGGAVSDLIAMTDASRAVSTAMAEQLEPQLNS